MAPNPLNPAAILDRMADALPTHEKDDTTSDLSGSLDAVALMTHAAMAALDFRLVGFNEDQKIESECTRLAPRLPPQWNNNPSSYSFVYAHTQSSMQFVIRVDRMGGKAEIRGLAVGDERIARFEIAVRDYVSNAALPVRITMTSEGAEDRSDLAEKLKKVFISEERIKDLTTLIKINIIQRLIPNLLKDGYEEDPDDRAARQDAEEEARRGGRAGGARQPPPAFPEPQIPQPGQPYPVNPEAPQRPGRTPDFPLPGFDDELDLNRPPGNILPGGGLLGNYGDSDLYPAGLGPHDPMRGSFVPGGLAPPGGRTGGGMHPTFDDPLFRGPGGGVGPEGNPDNAPPGARWDPIGPPTGGPRFPGRGGRGGRGGFGGGFGGGGFGGGAFGDII